MLASSLLAGECVVRLLHYSPLRKKIFGWKNSLELQCVGNRFENLPHIYVEWIMVRNRRGKCTLRPYLVVLWLHGALVGFVTGCG